MSVPHKFLETDFGNGFQTHNAILDTTPYDPKVLVIGTFNPQTKKRNHADFFYGRNYFWPAFFNLFEHNGIVLTDRRMPTNGVPQEPFIPKRSKILELCSKLEITFADMICEVLHEGNPQYSSLSNDNVLYNGKEYNLINDSKRKNVAGLAELNKVKQVLWNTNNIINYLSKNKSITTVYLTRNTCSPYTRQWRLISEHNFGRKVNFVKIYTPSGSRLPENPRMLKLIQHWLFNDSANYGTIDANWLTNNGVIIQNFALPE